MLSKFTVKKGAVAAVVIAAATISATGFADARPFHRHHHHHHRGFGIGAGIIGGLALGALATRAYSAPYCWTERQVVEDRYGRRFVRPVRLCN